MNNSGLRIMPLTMSRIACALSLAAILLCSCDHGSNDADVPKPQQAPAVSTDFESDVSRPDSDPHPYHAPVTEVEKLQARLEIDGKLKKKVSFELVDTELRDAIDFVNALLRVGIGVDPLVTESPISKKKITLKADKVELAKVLDDLLAQADPSLTYIIKPPVFITFRTLPEEERLRREAKVVKAVAFHLKYLRDSDPDIRQESCDMLAVLERAEAIPELISVLNPEYKERDRVRYHAGQALQKLTHQKFAWSEYSKWNSWWESQPKPYVVQHRLNAATDAVISVPTKNDR